ncbi:hypothetical protein CLIB1423_11S02300 [[Candida] railenensis]|uniref:Uncharacterized protein n=1 Tax=[Candida] railenensis TaxID=45579 RepID=A0A9P0QS19_9ASCO|nr:hypothetical protein CLIB1423_11S02300 [[Candida] railenensis]
MPNQYIFGYQQQTLPANKNVLLTNHPNNANLNYSPTFANTYPLDTASTTSSISSSYSSTSSSSSSSSASSSNSYQNPRLRYYLSKSFDIEDDLEFCPDIPENFESSPPAKKFNPYTASIFSPTSIQDIYSGSGTHSPSNNMTAAPQSPRSRTPRIKKPLEIINPQTKMRVGSSSLTK